MLRGVASPSFTGWEGVWDKFEEHQRERGAGQIRRGRCGHLDAPCEAWSPCKGPERYKAEVALAGFKLGKGGPGRGRTHLPLSMEPGEPWALLLGSPDPTANPWASTVGDAGRMWSGGGGGRVVKQEPGGARPASTRKEEASCTGCLWLGPGSPTRGLPLPLTAGAAATTGPTP